MYNITLVIINIFGAVMCAVAAHQNFTTGNVLIGISMCALVGLNVVLAIANLSR